MFNLFQSSRRFLSTLATQKAHEVGQVILYCWEPYPKTFLGLRNKPLFGRLSGGNTGHLAMQINYSDGTQSYISIWPEIHEDNHEGGIDIKPIVNSKSLATDIAAEGNRKPMSKPILVDKTTEEILKKLTRELFDELNKEIEQREQWSFTRNCATFIAEILYKSGLIANKPTFIATPSAVYQMVDQLEQQAYLENYRRPSFKD